MQIRQLESFRSWLEGLTEPAKGFIVDRLLRIKEGNLGSTRSLRGGLFEVKINYGPGYRLYYWRSGDSVILLLCGGNKSSQKKDIIKAQKLLEEIKNELKNY